MGFFLIFRIHNTKMNTTTPKSPYSIDLKLILIHFLLLISSYLIYKNFAYTPEKKDMSGIFFMLISVLGGIVGLIVLAVSLPRLDRTVRNLSMYKFFLAFLYWVSSTVIFIFFGISRLFYNNPLVLFVFVLIFYSCIYFSVVRIADMRKKDWLVLGGIFGAFVLLFFLPKI